MRAQPAARVVVGTGTTLSLELANRDWLDRRLQIRSVRHLYPRAYNVIVTSRGVADDMARYTGLDRSLITSAPPPTIDPQRVENALDAPPPPEQLRRAAAPYCIGPAVDTYLRAMGVPGGSDA